MPLPPPTAERIPMHLRSIQLNGYKRVDGLWDIEARLVDTKHKDYAISSKTIPAHEAVHDMWVRITIDREMNILAACASSDSAPYDDHCTSITPDYEKYLVGLNLFRGFRKAVKARLFGVHGCTHLSELLMVLPTAAMQTFASEVGDAAKSEHKPFQLDRCHALESHSNAVQRYYPRWFRGPVTGQASRLSDYNLNSSKENA